MSSWQNLAIPIALLITGMVLIGGDGIGLLSLDRIQNFWPLALIIVGVVEFPADKKQGS